MLVSSCVADAAAEGGGGTGARVGGGGFTSGVPLLPLPSCNIKQLIGWHFRGERECQYEHKILLLSLLTGKQSCLMLAACRPSDPFFNRKPQLSSRGKPRGCSRIMVLK